MRKHRNRSSLSPLVATLTLGLSSFAPASEARADFFKLDSGHSALLFRVKHLELNHFYGRFNALDGELDFDPKAPAKARVKVTVQTGSIDTNSKGRDGHLKGEAALAAERHPAITFESTHVTVAAPGVFRIRGNLTFRGTTKAIEAEARQVGQSLDEKGGGKIGFELAFTVKRSDFGMTGMGMVADEVHLFGGLEWNRVPPPPPANRED